MTKPLGYGAFVIFELYESKEGEEYVRFVLNAHPFEKEHKPVSDVQYMPTAMKLVFEVVTCVVFSDLKSEEIGFSLEKLKEFVKSKESAIVQ